MLFRSEDYIEDSDQRVIYYSRIGEIQTRKELDELIISMEDGFGEMPQETKNLCMFAYLRNLAGQFNVKRIVINKNDCIIYLEKDEKIIDEGMALRLDEYKGRLSFDQNVKIKFEFVGSVLDKLKKMLEFFESSSQES